MDEEKKGLKFFKGNFETYTRHCEKIVNKTSDLVLMEKPSPVSKV